MFRLQLAFPNSYAVPPHFCKFSLLFFVPFFVSTDFVYPELLIRLRDCVVLAAFVSVPEAAVYEDTSSVFLEYQIRMPWQPFVIESVSESSSPQPLSHNHFRLRVLRMDCRHSFVDPFWCEFVHGMVLLHRQYRSQVCVRESSPNHQFDGLVAKSCFTNYIHLNGAC